MQFTSRNMKKTVTWWAYSEHNIRKYLNKWLQI